jgi:uncharacterized protein (DUF885 family)
MRQEQTRALAMLMGLLAFIGSACASDDGAEAATAKGPSAADVDALAARYFEVKLERFPEFATLIGDHRYDDKLFETGAPARDRYVARIAPFGEEARALLGALAPSLDDERRLTLEVLIDEIAREAESTRLEIATLGVDQMDGPQATFAYFASTQHPMRNEADARALVARYRAIPAVVDGLITDLQRGLANGRASPDIVVDRVLAQLDALVDVTHSESPFVTAAARVPTTLPAASRAALVGEIERAAVEHVIESFDRYRTFIRDTYRARARLEPGVSSLPGGAEIYAFQSRVHTTTTLTPDEIHAMGLAELARIEDAMRVLAKERGYTGEIRAFLDEMRADRSGYAESRAALLDVYKSALVEGQAALPRAFSRLPKLTVEVREMDAARERDAPAAYYEPGSLTAERPGIFIANLHRFEERPLMNAHVLTFHEAVPGHHLQIALAQEVTTMPSFRREGHYSAFVEGWALYSEELAWELGLYPTLEAKLGALGFAAWRASRLVVDTGLHAKGWSRQHAIDFLASHTTLGKIDVENEIDRYIAWPGQALAYMVGKLRIVALRRELEAKLGPRFSLPRFHDVVLGSGALPLALLEEHVRRVLLRDAGR